MPSGVSAVSARPVRAGTARQVILLCLLLSLVYPLYVAAGAWGLPFGRTIHIYVDGREQTFRSYGRTVGDGLQAAQVALRPSDRVVPDAPTFLWPGIEVKIIRAVPVTLRIGRSVSSLRIAATSVDDALQLLGITLGPIDQVYPAPETAVRPGMRITVERREWNMWIEQRKIAFTSRTVADPQLFKGNRVVRTAGREGIDERTVEVLYADGLPSATFPHAWAAVQTPVNEVIAVGTRATIASRGSFEGREYMMLEATAYYPGPNNYGGGVGPRTAIGLLAQRGVVAVDPSVIPLGSKVYVEGYGYAIAGDTGGAIQGMKIDLCFNTYDEAIHFGRQTVKLYIVERH
ncbi:MAG TPA: 3D domain-containing protein [bacterium]|nr:3D domain-containing protein [bacterium]